MGAGASSASGNPSPTRLGNGGSSVTTLHKNGGLNGGSGGCSGSEVASRASASSDFPAPKQARHVVIHAANPKQRGGGLLDKLRQKASSNSPAQSSANSGNCSLADSEKSQQSPRSHRRDEYDVNSDDEDLDGFIYDDDSTSEDEREDYVNAFSRRRQKPGGGDDYSNYEGAAVRALTTAQRRSRVRRTRSSTTDDGDDEWDLEEQRIRQLRQVKKQEDKAKAAALATRKVVAAGAAGAGGGGRSLPEDGRPGPGPLNLAAAAQGAAPHPSQPLQPPPPQAPMPPQQQHQQHQQSRLAPQPPPEPPARGSSGSNLRRNVAAATAAIGSSYGGGAAGPGPGPGSGGGPAAAEAAPAAPRAGRPSPAPPQQVNYGASASSQYWQARRSQNGAPADNDGSEGQGQSRLEQLAALQRKRQAAGVGQDTSRGGDEASGRGVGGGAHGSGALAEPANTVVTVSLPAMHAALAAVGSTPAVPPGEAAEASAGRFTGSEQQAEQSAGGRFSEQGGGGRGGGGRTWASLSQDNDPPGRSCAAAGQPQQPPLVTPPREPPELYDDPGPSPPARAQLDGQSFIRHLEPPPHRQAQKAKSRRGAAGGGGGASAPTAAQVPRPAMTSHGSDVADFDVDEVLGSFSPAPAFSTAAAVQQQQQIWAGARPQPPPKTPPGQAPVQKRSIRAVQSDFASIRTSDLGDSVSDLTGRVLSLPLPASRPVGGGVGSGGGGGGGGFQSALVTCPAKPSVTSAPVAVSRFARMGATMTGQSSTQDGTGASSAPISSTVAAKVGVGGNGGYRSSGAAATATNAAGQVGFSGGGQAAAASPPRRPRRSNPSSDGAGPSPTISSSLSAPPWDGSGLISPTVAVHGGGSGPATAPTRATCGANAFRPSSPSGSGDTALTLPALRPSSGGGGGGGGGGAGTGTGAGSSILNTVGRSRFAASQQQQWQQEVARTSVPAGPLQRDYDSDSALTRNVGGQVRYSYNGAAAGGGGGRGAGGVAASILPASVFEGGATAGGMLGPAARGRWGQVGA